MLHKKSNLIKSILIAAFRKYDESEERERERKRQREALMPRRIARLALLNIQVHASRLKKLFMGPVLRRASGFCREMCELEEKRARDDRWS